MKVHLKINYIKKCTAPTAEPVPGTFKINSTASPPFPLRPVVDDGVENGLARLDHVHRLLVALTFGLNGLHNRHDVVRPVYAKSERKSTHEKVFDYTYHSASHIHD